MKFVKKLNHITSIDEAKTIIQRGGILAYPTEAVYGLGCDPFNKEAVEALLALKGRDADKGLILLISNWEQLFSLIDPITAEQLSTVRATWPGFVTWVFPKSPLLPTWLTGKHNSIAIRMSAHPLAHALCTSGPLVSTSANISGQKPAQNQTELYHQFPKGIDAVLEGELGGFSQPSAIYDVQNGHALR